MAELVSVLSVSRLLLPYANDYHIVKSEGGFLLKSLGKKVICKRRIFLFSDPKGDDVIGRVFRR